MKKIFYLFCLMVFSSISLWSYAARHPEANFGIYGIQYCNSLSEYQKYIGETVVYLPKEIPSYVDKNMFSGKFNKEYIIKKITGSDGFMTFLLQEKEGMRNVKMYIYTSDDRDDSYYITKSFSVPLFLIDKFNKDKMKYIGKKYSNDKVIIEYECVDVVMKTKNNKYSYMEMPYPTMHCILKNSITGKEEAYPAENIETECFAEHLSGEYISTLIKVEKPADESVRYGETKIVKADSVTKYSYIDDFIDILIFGDSINFSFLLKNISQNSLKLVWNEAVFVDFNGNTSKVMHVGTKYSDKELDQPAATIIKGAHIEDIAVPTSNIRYSDILKEWVTESMYPSVPTTSPGEIKLMLPIQVKDVINEYVFVFRVDRIYRHPELIKK
jgi:hypothetical protein